MDEGRWTTWSVLRVAWGRPRSSQVPVTGNRRLHAVTGTYRLACQRLWPKELDRTEPNPANLQALASHVGV